MGPHARALPNKLSPPTSPTSFGDGSDCLLSLALNAQNSCHSHWSGWVCRHAPSSACILTNRDTGRRQASIIPACPVSEAGRVIRCSGESLHASSSQPHWVLTLTLHCELQLCHPEQGLSSVSPFEVNRELTSWHPRTHCLWDQSCTQLTDVWAGLNANGVG